MSKIRTICRILRSLHYSIYFNFHYLPFKSAIKLPILLYKPKLLKIGGRIEITRRNTRPGMIRLGFPTVSIYPNTGITWENRGRIIFKGNLMDDYSKDNPEGKLFIAGNPAKVLKRGVFRKNGDDNIIYS